MSAVNLRDYQTACSDSVLKEFESVTSTLVVMPTGTGKTQVFCDVARRMLPLRTMIVAHREELIFQAHARAESFGLSADIEMADRTVQHSLFDKPQVVVSTVQTQTTGGSNQAGRMHRFDPRDFGLLIVDESHRCGGTATYDRLLAHYRQNPSLKVLGVTATPDRTDEIALGSVFESVAYEYEILDAINDGWLVDIDQQMVVVRGLDFSGVRSSGRDLNEKDLARVLEDEDQLHRIASPAIELMGDKRSLVFAASVKQAERLCEIFNRHAPGKFRFVYAGTPKEERRELIADYKSGKVQGVVNVGILTEGVDVPEIEVVVMARPTKSRIVFSQAIGRSLRPLPGVVDGLDTPEERRLAIANSAKPRALICDFVGNSGRHKLVHTGDILGGRVPDEIVEEFNRRAKKSGEALRVTDSFEDIRQEIEESKRRDEANRLAVRAKATYLTHSVSPFDAWDLTRPVRRGWHEGKRLSDKQTAILVKQGIDPAKMAYHEAKALIDEQFRRWKNGLCSYKQGRCLRKHGYDTADMTREIASATIDSLAKNGWRRPAGTV